MARVTLSILRKKRVLQAQHVVKFYRTLLYRNLLGFAAHQCRRRSGNRNTTTEMCTSDTLQYTLYSWNNLLETELKRGSGNAYRFIHVCSSYIVLTTQNQIIDKILWHSQGAHIEVAIRTKRIWRFSLPGHTSIEFRHRPRNEVSCSSRLRFLVHKCNSKLSINIPRYSSRLLSRPNLFFGAAMLATALFINIMTWTGDWLGKSILWTMVQVLLFFSKRAEMLLSGNILNETPFGRSRIVCLWHFVYTVFNLPSWNSWKISGGSPVWRFKKFTHCTMVSEVRSNPGKGVTREPSVQKNNSLWRWGDDDFVGFCGGFLIMPSHVIMFMLPNLLVPSYPY